jgi:glycosyltransferase involved in cell wall biosynthesis
MEKTISCVLTIHNKEDLIERVCSGINNNLSELTKEIIIVLDGCVDRSEEIVRDLFKNSNKKITYVYTDDVFELKANNAGLKNVTTNYALLIQDDMVINENEFDKRMLKPFIEFSDVFAVTAQTAHNNRIFNDILHATDSVDRRYDYPRDMFGIREIANRGPLMYNYNDLVKLNFFDEYLAPNSYDDHDLSYKAYRDLNKVSGLYWIDYESRSEWGTGRQKNQNIHQEAHVRNSRIIMDRYSDLLTGIIKNEDRELK